MTLGMPVTDLVRPPERGALSRHVRRWGLWSLPTRVIFPILMVELTATVIFVGLVLGSGPLSLRELQSAVVLCVLGIGHAEISIGVERIRRRVSDGNYVDLSSVWTFAAAVLLPIAYAVPVAVAVVVHLWLRAWRPRVPLYRFTFSTTTVVLACLAASAVMHSIGRGPLSVAAPNQLDLVVVMVAVLAYTTVNSCLIAGAIALTTAQPERNRVFASWDENFLEFATLCLGALTAAAVTINPWLVLFVFPPLLVLHRAVLVRHLEVAASTDSKTGLLNAAAWHTQAERELQRGGRRVGPKAVLVVDLDRFKAVNDTYGHLAGDRVLAAVADAMRAEVRERDLVGRFGGEEFVVLLGGLDGPGDGQVELEAVAERIRRRIAVLQVEMPTADGPLTIASLSASVGGALYPGDGRDLRTLLQVADTALYAAKRAGRNLVRMGMQLPATVEIDHEAVDSAR